MKNSVSNWIILIFLIFCGKPISAFTQALIRMDQHQFDRLGKSDYLWIEKYKNSIFLLVPYLESWENKGFNIELLDPDVETGKFYWMNALFQPLSWRNRNFQSDDFRILWSDDYRALVRTRHHRFIQDLPGQPQAQRINFRCSQKQPMDYQIRRPEVAVSTADIVQSIIDSVSIEQIYEYERHLSGIEPFWLYGNLDSLSTRYSEHPHIFKAQNYIKECLEQMGYQVELDPFGGGGILNDVQFAPDQANTGWVITTDRIYGSLDSGQSWTIQYQSNDGLGLWSVFPVNHLIAYVVGDYGKILFTSNAGQNWQVQNSPAISYHFGVFFRNATLGWIAGDVGNIMKTTDGGTSWQLKSTPSSSRLYDVFFIDDLEGWAVGQNGAIIHSIDGGESWQTQTSGTGSRLHGVYFLNPDTGFVVGWSGQVRRTVNGGTSWNALSVPINDYFYDIDFVDAQNGIIVGWNGSCLKTTNGGSSWTTDSNILQSDAYAVDFVDAQHIWAAGDGLIARNEGFGTVWQSQLPYLPEATLNNVVATKTGTVSPDQYYIICAHYDDMPPGTLAPGADDNASGTVTVLEAARVLADYDFQKSIRFVLFAGEEQGLVGSAHYAALAATNGDQILGVINLDMIGYDFNNDGRMEIHAGTMLNSQELGTFVRGNIINWGLSLTPEYITSGSTSASDHASFWYNGYPAILLIEDFQDFTPYYHTVSDELSTLRQSYFESNAKLAIGSLAVLAIIDSGATGITEESLLQNFILYEPYPNPFNPSISVEYVLPSAEKVRAEVYDLLGQKVKELNNNTQSAGRHKISWPGDATNGQPVASGIYLLKISTANWTAVKKIFLIR